MTMSRDANTKRTSTFSNQTWLLTTSNEQQLKVARPPTPSSHQKTCTATPTRSFMPITSRQTTPLIVSLAKSTWSTFHALLTNCACTDRGVQHRQATQVLAQEKERNRRRCYVHQREEQSLQQEARQVRLSASALQTSTNKWQKQVLQQIHGGDQGFFRTRHVSLALLSEYKPNYVAGTAL